MDEGGGAWCPSKPVGGGGANSNIASNSNSDKSDNNNNLDLIPDGDASSSVYEGEEFLQIDLGNITVVTHVLTQGRSVNNYLITIIYCEIVNFLFDLKVWKGSWQGVF